jgi:hypothetical protein
VIDCDEYADGSKSDSYLIFPILKTRGGKNRVHAHRWTAENRPLVDTSKPANGRRTQDRVFILDHG